MIPITNIRTILEAAIITCFMIYVGVLSYQKYSLKNELQEVKYSLAKSQALNEQYKVSVDKQNIAVEDLLKSAEATKKKNAEELAKANKEAARLKSEAANILLKQKPQNVSDCDAAHSLIIEEINK